MRKKDILISEAASIKDAIKKLDKTAEKVLLVTDKDNQLLGTITDGDVRRYILKGRQLESDIREIYNRTPIFIRKGSFALDKVKDVFLKNKIELLPILDKDNKIVDFITWSETFSDSGRSAFMRSRINIPVIIMAGGKGTRLEPFSRIFPKSLLPIGDRPIIELIIDEFKKQGVSQFYLVLNYKGAMLEAYFNSIEKDYKIKYVKESTFLGTAGGLRLLENEISDIFIVSNCDIIVKANFEEVLELHKKEKAVLTVLSSIQHHKIPYGVIELQEGGRVVAILEKPEYTFTVNSGVYMLSKESLQFMPKKAYFDMTDLIKMLVENKKKVITYPVNESDYIDIGQWEEYKKSMDNYSFLNR